MFSGVSKINLKSLSNLKSFVKRVMMMMMVIIIEVSISSLSVKTGRENEIRILHSYLTS